MMRLAIFLLVGTLVVYGVTRIVPPRYGAEVGARFLERHPSYTADSLATWVRAHGADAAGYAVPVLFPLDLLFMAFLAAFLAVASIALAGSVDRLAGAAWLFVLVPALYLGTDLAEDTLLARFLMAPETITPAVVRAAQALTRIKIWTVSIAGAQVVGLGLLALVWRR